MGEQRWRCAAAHRLPAPGGPARPRWRRPAPHPRAWLPHTPLPAPPGTTPNPTTHGFRILAGITQALGAVYLVWRALRTLRPGWYYLYSIPFW